MQNEVEVSNNEVEMSKTYFIEDEKYQRIRQCQQSIYETTEVSPSIRKIVNELITEENLQKVKTKYLSVFNI